MITTTYRENVLGPHHAELELRNIRNTNGWRWRWRWACHQRELANARYERLAGYPAWRRKVAP